MRRAMRSGYTLVELMVVVAIIGILAAVATPAFMRYIKKSKTAEAREFIRKIYMGARAYYQDTNAKGGTVGGTIIAPMFPEPSAPPTPALGTCCASGKCEPSQAYWETPTWVALAFSMDDPHYFHYAYTVTGNTPPGSMPAMDGSNNYTALAYGDLDCDGNYSTWSMYGEINSVYADGPAGSAALASEKALE